jgi:hypothetical protein
MPRRVLRRTVVPLSRQPGGVQNCKTVIPTTKKIPELTSREGYEGLYVIAGSLRLVLADPRPHAGPGEVAEFDTRMPHWFGTAGDGPAEGA